MRRQLISTKGIAHYYNNHTIAKTFWTPKTPINYIQSDLSWTIARSSVNEIIINCRLFLLLVKKVAKKEGLVIPTGFKFQKMA